MRPSREEVKGAFRAGFQSIDEGESFNVGFAALLEGLGYRRREDAACGCSDGGAHGHLPECRWVKG